MSTLACGPREHLLVVQVLTIMHGYKKSWIRQAKRGSSGCRRTTWYTTTARTWSDSHKASLKNVLLLKIRSCLVHTNRLFHSSTVCESNSISKTIFVAWVEYCNLRRNYVLQSFMYSKLLINTINTIKWHGN